MKKRRGIAAVMALGLLAALGVGPSLFRAQLERWEDNSILRGRRLAVSEGCLACHLPPSSAEIPNPGSRWGTVPRFRGGNAMMYGSTRGEIEEIVRLGTRRSSDSEAAEGASQRVLMPAYGVHLDAGELSDLLDYVCAEERIDLPGDEPTRAGRQLAREQGCTSCHGVEGAGGRPNPGSLGGFVPGFLGRNFEHLVRDRGEFGEWIRKGRLQRLAANPLIARYWRKQRLSMPAYEDLSEEEIDRLWAWVRTMREWSSRQVGSGP